MKEFIQTIKGLFFTLTILLSLGALKASNPHHFHIGHKNDAAFQWVEQTFESLTPKERIGQLFMLAAYSNNKQNSPFIEKMIKEYGIGGLIFMQGGPHRQAILNNKYQSISKVPLLIAMDAEWGLSMRLDSTISYPRQMTLGAIQDDQWIEKMGIQIGKECKRLGVHVNFAPVVDVNVNPNNPVIGTRSFGEDKYNVAKKGSAYMRGLQSQHVLANAKHFPGHGDTDKDSHKALPVINHDLARLQDIEFYPFQELIKDSLASMMIAHLHVPALDSTPKNATTLSKHVVTDILKEQMGFKGLIFTDALNMRGVADHNNPGEVDLKALLAGNDVLLFPQDIPLAAEKIQNAIDNNLISQKEVNRRVKKILYAKYWAGLHNEQKVKRDQLTEDLLSAQGEALRFKLYEKAVTVAKNKDNFVPIRILDTNDFASISIGAPKHNTFQTYLSKYAKFSHYFIGSAEASSTTFNRVYDIVKDKEVVVLGLHNMSNRASKHFGISRQEQEFIKKLSETTRVILVAFGNPYSLKYVDGPQTVICTYQDNEDTRKIAPQVIFGGIGADGKLPVTASKEFPVGMGVKTISLNRMGYCPPSLLRMDGQTLEEVDQIVQEALDAKATPGCQVLVARRGKVVYEKNYGYYTYQKKKPVSDSTLYDIASITKVAASMQVVMFLVENGEINLDSSIVKYLPELEGSNKANMTIRNILTHQAGLKPFIPYYRHSLDSIGQLNDQLYCDVRDGKEFCYRVADSIYAHAIIEDSIWKWTIDSDLLEPDKERNWYPYRYSDVGYYLIKKIGERILNQPYNEFLEQNFYAPLGANHLTYLPTEKYDTAQIAPTELDHYFRMRLVHGTVHDPGAAMIGGVAGHAGLFATANDLAKLFQMNLQNGSYAGQNYFYDNTVAYFTSQQYEDSRRGIGWDRTQIEGRGPTGEYCWNGCFGHTGFTGTAAWVDRETDLMYIFLSNRVYPDAENKKLLRMDIRTRIQDKIYESLLNYEEMN